METSNTSIELFSETAKLPSEVIAIIVGYLPKCILPNLLYFPPIREIVASTILSDVQIGTYIFRHEGSDEPDVGYSKCYCDRFDIKFSNLKKGIEQWNIYPKAIHMEIEVHFKNVLDTFPRLLKEALSINGSLSSRKGSEAETVLNLILNSNIRFDSLELSNFRGPIVPPVATNIKLSSTILNSYNISGMKKLDIKMDFSDDETHEYTFSSDLEDLTIDANFSMQVTLPPNLRKLCVRAGWDSVDFISQEMVYLEHLQLKLPSIESFEDIGIIAPNLKTLVLTDCEELSNYDNLKQFQHLKHLVLTHCEYPFSLLRKGTFLELESFEYTAGEDVHPDDFTDELLTFPANLKQLTIHCCDFVNLDLENLILPSTLTQLELHHLIFDDDYFYLSENLQHVHIEATKLTFDSSFRIPPMAEQIKLLATCVTFESWDFMYHLPNSLTSLHLATIDKENPIHINQRIKWPLMLGSFTLKGFDINCNALELLNMKESRLEVINISECNIETLNIDLFPISVKNLTLMQIGIRELPASFEKLKNLRELSLMRTRLKKVNPVKLPISSLKVLDLCQCDLRLLSPFLISMLEEKNKNAKLLVDATGNWNLNITDVKSALKAIRGLSLHLNKPNSTLSELFQYFSRVDCMFNVIDPYFEEPEAEEVAVSDYDSKDFYKGSLIGLNGEDNDDCHKRRRMQ